MVTRRWLGNVRVCGQMLRSVGHGTVHGRRTPFFELRELPSKYPHLWRYLDLLWSGLCEAERFGFWSRRVYNEREAHCSIQRDRGRREAALFRHLTNGHHNRISFFDAELLT